MSDISAEAKNVESLDFVARRRLSPINRRRWQIFCRHKRGFWSLWVFLALFLASLGAEFIANDRPIIAYYKGELLFPIFVNYPEEKFGGFLATTDYRDKIIRQEMEAHGWMLWPPIHFADQTRNFAIPTNAPSPPTWALSDSQCRLAAQRQGLDPQAGKACNALEWNWLGTDPLAHDVIARALYGLRISLLFGLLLTITSSVIGIAAGAIQGYFGGWVDLISQRLIEIWTALPQLYILLIIASILSPGFFILLGVMLLFSWVHLVHVVRAEFLRARNFEYVNAARALGLSNGRIIVKHVLPNAMVATLTFLPFITTASISTLTALDILGFGMPPGSPSLGELLLQGRDNLSAPWISLTGFFTIAITLILLVFIGEGVRDAFDPRKTLS